MSVIKRRHFLKTAAVAAASAVPACVGGTIPQTETAVAPTANLNESAVYIPGYAPEQAFVGGKLAFDDSRMMRNVPRGYDGSLRLLTRFDLDGSIRQAIFPVRGHDIAISPDRRIGYFGAMEGADYISFDPRNLNLIAMGRAMAEGWNGGGHSVFLPDAGLVAVTERAPRTPFGGNPSHHFGRITLREPGTLKIVETHSTHGISPHEIRLLSDGRHAVVANYGSTVPPDGGDRYGTPRHMVEPSITVVDLQSGALAEKYVSRQRHELRHLCARDAETIFAIQAELGGPDADQRYHRGGQVAYQDEPLGAPDESYLVAPTVRTAAGRLQPLGRGQDRQLMRQGLSIEYDPRFDEVVASYPSSQTVLVFDADSGQVKHRIDCAAIGLNYPCGVAMLPGQDFYVVAGYWQNLFVFERGSHRLRRELTHYPITFGHSHIVAA